MTIRSDSFCVSLKKMQGLSDSQLLSLADDIFVMDVLPELLHYIQKRAPISVRDVVQASSLPNLLTLAYLVRALKDGLLKRKKSGLMLAADLELADEVPVEELLSSSPALSLQGQARLSLLRELMAEHGDLRENMKILAFGDNEALEPLSTQESLQISRVSAVNTATNTEMPDSKIQDIPAHFSMLSGAHLGIFDSVLINIPDPLNGEVEWVATASSNHHRYGVLYFWVEPHCRARGDYSELLSDFTEHGYLVTDMRQREGVTIFRALKIPELHEEFSKIKRYAL